MTNRFRVIPATCEVDDACPIMVGIGDAPEHRTTWGEFLKDNAHLDGHDLFAILTTWAKRPGCTYHGGGGAEAEWTVRLIVD